MKKILILDDSPEIRTLLNQFLSMFYEVVTFDNGFDALEWLHKGELPNLILSDIQMPEMNGEEFVTQLKSSGFFKDIPVIMLSSLTDSSERVKFLKLGASDYINKPFNPEELQIRIENIITR